MKPHILLIDDDNRLLDLLKTFLEKNDYLVTAAQNGKEGLDCFEKKGFDLIIVDRMMPYLNGIDFLERIRKKNNTIPVLMLTALGEIEDKIKGLESGADDYLTKPFEPKELLLRIKNILKRIQTTEIISFSNFSFDRKKQILKNGEIEIQLGTTDKIVLSLLTKNINESVSKERLATELGVAENGVMVQILRLRKKINDIDGKIIETIRHKGYRIKNA